VMLAQDMIEVSRLNGMAAEMQKVQTAYNEYKQKYNQTPGDDKNAFSYFSTDCAAAAEDCNGNGDKDLRDTYDMAGTHREYLMFWRHLYLAKLYNQNLTGSLTAPLVIGKNLPKTNIDGATFVANTWRKVCYYLAHTTDEDLGLGYCESGKGLGVRANMLSVNSIIADGIPSGATLTPTSAQIIDAKIDDGKPNAGNIIASARGECVDSTQEILNDIEATYNVSTASENCYIAAILEEPV